MVLLTIVTVVKNDPVGLRATYDSLAHQVDTDLGSITWEWVVVDGSDQPENFSPDQKFSGAFVYMHQIPSGIYPAMNHALSAATGEYVLFLNAGDQLAQQDTLVHLIASLASKPDWLFGKVNFLSPSGSPLREREWSYQEEKKALFARGYFPPHQGTVMRTQELVRIGGFSEDLKLVADYEAMLKISQLSDPTVVDYPIAVFSQGGASSIHWRQALREFHVARRRVLQPRGISALRELLDSNIQIVKHVSSAVKSKIMA